MQSIERWLLLAAEAYPYYARGFAALTPVERRVDPGPTIAVDKYWRLYWTPEALQHLRDHGGSQADCIRHELEHLLREHADRRHDRAADPWNVACDCEINDELTELPNFACRMDPAGELAEYYYDRAPQTPPTCGGGSGVDGQPRPYELPVADAPAVECSGPLLDAIAQDIQAAAERGDVPSGVRVWADARRGKRVVLPDWRVALRQAVREYERGRADYSYARMSRRQGSARILLPGTVRPRGRASVVIDTSGSMGSYGDWIASVLGELRRTGIECELIDCDAAVHQRRPLRSWRDVLSSRGGGGTDLRVGIEAAPRGSLVIALTDGETPWPQPWPRNLVALVYNGRSTMVRRAT